MKSKDKVGHKSVLKRFVGEFRTISKPSVKVLVRSTFKIMIAAICAACVISLIDFVFTQLLNMFV